MLNYDQPDARGHFGPVNGSHYGGTFVAETLVHALDELKAAYAHFGSHARSLLQQPRRPAKRTASSSFDGLRWGGKSFLEVKFLDEHIGKKQTECGLRME